MTPCGSSTDPRCRHRQKILCRKKWLRNGFRLCASPGGVFFVDVLPDFLNTVFWGFVGICVFLFQHHQIPTKKNVVFRKHESISFGLKASTQQPRERARAFTTTLFAKTSAQRSVQSRTLLTKVAFGRTTKCNHNFQFLQPWSECRNIARVARISAISGSHRICRVSGRGRSVRILDCISVRKGVRCKRSPVLPHLDVGQHLSLSRSDHKTHYVFAHGSTGGSRRTEWCKVHRIIRINGSDFRSISKIRLSRSSPK